MTQKIVVINQKGGVGKTATAINLAYNLSIQNKKTLIVDLDPSANATTGLIKDQDVQQLTYTVQELFMDKNFDPRKSTYQLSSTLSIIPSKIELATTEDEIARRIRKEMILSKQLNKIEDQYDYILIDSGPTLSSLHVNAMFAANFILIPVIYNLDSLSGLKALFRVLEEVKEDQDYQFKILRNQLDLTKKSMVPVIEGYLENFIKDQKVFNTTIRQCEEINKAKKECEPITIFAPNSRGTMDYDALTKELLSCLE